MRSAPGRLRAHRHWVFTIPRALRQLFARERPLLGLLARAGAEDMAFAPLDLVHALAQQIPDKGRRLVRY